MNYKDKTNRELELDFNIEKVTMALIGDPDVSPDDGLAALRRIKELSTARTDEQLREVLAWARVAYRAVKFSEAIKPTGLHSLVETAPPLVKKDE